MSTLVERAESLSLPSSVIEFLQGCIGHPVGGFPEPLRSRVVKDRPTINGRPGASLDPVNMADLHTALKEKFEGSKISHRDLLSAAMYPKVFDDYMHFKSLYSRHLEHLPTRAFLAPLDVDEDIDVELSKGNVVNIKYKAKGELQPSGMREVFSKQMESHESLKYETPTNQRLAAPQRYKQETKQTHQTLDPLPPQCLAKSSMSKQNQEKKSSRRDTDRPQCHENGNICRCPVLWNNKACCCH
eukprot:jgi/Picre1/32716/NNA_008061.t1